jgi:hypothetical protein
MSGAVMVTVGMEAREGITNKSTWRPLWMNANVWRLKSHNTGPRDSINSTPKTMSKELRPRP